MEVLLSIRYIKVVIALLVEAAIARQGACVIRLLDDVVGVAVLHGLVITVVKGHWILVIDVEVR